MNKPLPTITIGIAAYNEENNIRRLLYQTTEQIVRGAQIIETILYSDGSTDGTMSEASKVIDKRIRIVEGEERHGANGAKNQLIKMAKGDILVLLDADILLQGKSCLDMLIAPLLTGHATGLTSAATVPLAPRSYIEQALALSHRYKIALYRASFPDGDTPYFCHGRARAFSRSLYRLISFPDQCPEDSYSYFFAKSVNQRFAYANDAVVSFRSPCSLADFSKQSHRFQRGKEALKKYFSEHIILPAYRLRFFRSVWITSVFFFRYPVSMITYLGILAWVRLTTFRRATEQTRWSIALTSKELI